MYSVRYRPQVATLALRRGGSRSFLHRRKVMAYPPHGSAQKERIRFALCCVAVLLRRFLCQRARGGHAVWNGKGEEALQYRIGYSARKVRIALISLACSRSRISSSTP